MPTHEIELNEALRHFESLLDEVKSGVEIVLSDHHAPIARIIRYEPLPARKPGLQAGGAISVAEDFDEPLPDSYWIGKNE